MKRRAKPWQFFLPAILILVFAYLALFGLSRQTDNGTVTYVKGASDIRFGIDIKGGVDVTFMVADGTDATDEQLDAAESVIQQRLVGLNITDSEVYVDYNKDRIIVRFPWKTGETEFNPETAIDEIGTTAHMTFHKGSSESGELIFDGSAVKSASARYGAVSEAGTNEYYVVLELNDEGRQALADATTELYASKGMISIWLDDQCISAATVNDAITDGVAVITGGYNSATGQRGFAQEDAITLARQINSGALPFALSAESYSTLSPSLGSQSLEAMVIAGIIAFVLICVFMISVYRLPGFVACIGLLGQMAGTIAAVSGFFPVFNSFTLTLPGIAGIILAIGMGVDANVITAERIREELRGGKTLDGALKAGFSRGLTPIIDGNVTIVIVAVVLMGAFGPTNSLCAKLLTPLFFMFGPSTAGTVYSFGYTLLVGVLLNFVFGVLFSRIMLRGISQIKALRNPWLYGASNKLAAKQLNVAGKRKVFLGISGGIAAVVVLASLILGVSMDIQFKGGSMIVMSYDGEISMSEAQKAAESVLGKGLTLQSGSNAATGQQTVTINLPGAQTLTTEELQNLTDALQEACPDNHMEQLQTSTVNPTIGGEFLRKCLVAVVAAVVLILLYIAWRFRRIGGLPAGVIAVIALFSDLVAVFGAFVLMRIPLNGNFVAAMLTILGYSINDTVVMYDRIRENRNLYGDKMPFEELVNHSVNQSLRRSINTTLTTCLALATICVMAVVFGLDSIFTFAMPLMVGMISGVYTSLCLTTSLWVLWEGKRPNKKKHTAR